MPIQKIILPASGMAIGGRAMNHPNRFQPVRRSAVVLAGHQAAGTRGASLLAGAETLRIHGEDIPVRAGIHDLSMLSAHSDADKTQRWFVGIRAAERETLCVHYEPRALAALKERIEFELGWKCRMPQHLKSVVMA